MIPDYEEFEELCEKMDQELADEIKRQEGFMRAVEESVLKIIYEIHPDFDEVPTNIKTRITKDLHQAAVEINELLDYVLTGKTDIDYGMGASPVREIDETEHPLLKQSYEKAKEKIVKFFPEIYEADSQTLLHINMTCFVSMHLFEEGFNFLCVDYLEYFVKED